MYKITDRIKITMTEKVNIDGVTKSVIQWINSDPIVLDRYLYKNPHLKLNPHGELSLKKKLNEKDERSNTKRSSSDSSKE